VVGRLREPPRPLLPGCGREQQEDVGEIAPAEVAQGVGGRAEVYDMAAGCEQQELGADVQVGDVVRDHDDGAVVVGELAQRAHHRPVHARVEPRGRLVEEQQGRLREQFERDARALALAAGQADDPLLGVRGEAQLGQHLLDRGVPRAAWSVSAGNRRRAAYERAWYTVSWVCSTSSCGTSAMRWRSSS
jgi:hypothetical protein